MKESGTYEGDTHDISAIDLSENPQDVAAEYDRFIESFSAVTHMKGASAAERKVILLRASLSLYIDNERATERRAYRSLLDFNQKVDAFKRRRRRIIDAFLLSVSYSPCTGRQHRRSGRFGLRLREVCQATATNHEDVRQIIATDKEFVKDLSRGARFDVAKNRFDTGGYGL